MTTVIAHGERGDAMRLGFIGLGIMGEAMASNLRRSGLPLTVWNRSAPARDRLIALGAQAAAGPRDVLQIADATFVMLSNERVMTEVLAPDRPDFEAAIAGRGLVHMGTTAPAFSARLDAAVRSAQGWYVEAPVSGSRVPAWAGELVAMAAGPSDRIDELEPALAAMCRRVVRCGQPPSATTLKLAVNIHLLGVVTALAEAWHFAARQGLDASTFAEVIRSGQLGSPVVGAKLDKLLAGDLSPQAAVLDVWKNAEIIADAAYDAGICAPVLTACHTLFTEAMEQSLGEADMIAVLRAIERRTDRVTGPPAA